MEYLRAILTLASMGILFGAGLAIVAKKFAVESNPREEIILDSLPGANCGACGFPGCSGYASAVVKGEAGVDRCPVGGPGTATVIGKIMGVETTPDTFKKRVARVRCRGGRTTAADRFEYKGISSCRAANMLNGGPKACLYGCLGFGDCVKACTFGAMHMDDDGIPAVDEEFCTACGKCVEACPRGIIELLDQSHETYVLCMSLEKGAKVKKVCSVGCIGCGICEKNCPDDAIKVQNNLARVIPEKCINCGICAEKCPTKCIISSGYVDGRRICKEPGCGGGAAGYEGEPAEGKASGDV
jgi:electron transport complex protein RnfB